MRIQVIVGIFLMVFMISCSKEEAIRELVYSNNFDSSVDLDAYTIGFGEIKISGENPVNNSAGCLNILGWCPAPNLTIEIGPFEKSYSISMEAWIKTDYGAAIHLNLKSQSTNYVRIETKEDLFEARKWNLYKSDKLDVPEGESLMLYIDASNTTLSNTWIDELKIYGQAY